MSFDLVVFDPQDVSREREAFIDWFVDYEFGEESAVRNDLKICTEGLRDWYRDIVKRFPDYNDSINSNEQPGDYATGYSVGKSGIYADFRWSVAEEAYDAVRQLAVKHKVGFYDAEGEGEIYFPGGQLAPPSDGVWREVSRQFRNPPENPPKGSWWDNFRRNT